MIRPYQPTDAAQCAELISQQFRFVERTEPGALGSIRMDWTARDANTYISQYPGTFVDDRAGRLYSVVIGSIEPLTKPGDRERPWYWIRIAAARADEIDDDRNGDHVQYTMRGALPDAVSRGAAGTYLWVPPGMKGLRARLEMWQNPEFYGDPERGWQCFIPASAGTPDILAKTQAEPPVRRVS